MRAYLVEDLRKEHGPVLVQALLAKGFDQPLDGLFWLPVPRELLTGIQREHEPECGPYVMGLEIMDTPDGCALKLELLVRAKGRLRCSCVAYASPEQRNQIIDFLDEFIKDLDISV